MNIDTMNAATAGTDDPTTGKKSDINGPSTTPKRQKLSQGSGKAKGKRANTKSKSSKAAKKLKTGK